MGSINKSDSLICLCCGEIYSLGDFSEQDPLEVCGECGSEYFLDNSVYSSLEHYLCFMDILPEHLRLKLPFGFCPRLSPFRKFWEHSISKRN